MKIEEFRQIASGIPGQPGIYKYFDVSGALIYVGKAKDLRKRVNSYFVRRLENYKTRKLVEHIHHIEFTIVGSEQDAFLLENSLIKQFQPRYNINLRDDKSYPYIVIRNEPFPRIFLTRRRLRDKSEYLGPFTGVGKVRDLLEFIRENIPLRTCGLNLSAQNIRKGKFRVCLEYHLGNCKGPCEAKQSSADYQESLQQVKNILKGNLAPVIRIFQQQMKDSAAALDFEKAELIRSKIQNLQTYRARSEVVHPRIDNVDVFAMEGDEHYAYVNYLMVLHGSVVATKTVTLEKKMDEDDRTILIYAISYLRENFHSSCGEIIVPFDPDYPDKGIKITVPRGGDKKKLLDLAGKNAAFFREETRKRKMLHLEERTTQQEEKILFGLQEDLQLPVFPAHIECFDNSNFQGSFPVSACIVFRHGVPSKADYRHYNIKTVQGIDDFASMAETVYRRYKRLLEEQQSLPQLVVIDGGKGQLNAAMGSIVRLDLTGRMTLVGLAKNLEEIYYSGDQQSVRLPYGSESLLLLRRIRDEVHRFGVSFHRKKRSGAALVNELESIKGIGKNTADQLLRAFKSVSKIKQLSEKEIAAVTGPKKAILILAHFRMEGS
ncbi:MAG TPA: excinuclease ABC subunit UvrC [Chitinophagaceae bacterium]|nr:excinuclease ABC subunit UvrC [Chitinophagaceae bacterium]